MPRGLTLPFTLMTTRDIEREEYVTTTDQVEICDYCKSDEREGTGDIITYMAVNGAADEYPELHFHEECIEAEIENRGPRIHLDELTESHTWYAATRFDILAISISILAIIFASYVALLGMVEQPGPRAALIVVVALLAVFISKIHGLVREKAEQAIGEIDWDWRQ